MTETFIASCMCVCYLHKFSVNYHPQNNNTSFSIFINNISLNSFKKYNTEYVAEAQFGMNKKLYNGGDRTIRC